MNYREVSSSGSRERTGDTPPSLFWVKKGKPLKEEKPAGQAKTKHP